MNEPLQLTADAVPPAHRARSDDDAWTRVGPARVALALLAFGLLWTVLLASTRRALPIDTVEQWVWAHAPAWGYYKHPPLPTWVLWGVSRVAGLSGATAVLLGAATTLTSLGTLWMLLSRLRGQRHASIALAAVLCVTYYNGRLDFYNHDVLLLLASTACAVALERALATRRLRWWVGVGLSLGLGALTKYQIAITVLCVIAVVAHERAWRDPGHRIGMLAAMTLAAALFAPHALWLAQQDDGPIQYALGSALGARLDAGRRVTTGLHFLADQWLNRCLPAWLMLALLWKWQRQRPAHDGRWDRARVIVTVWGALPLAFVAAMACASGSGLQWHWGMPYVAFLVAAVMECLPLDMNHVPLRALALAFVAVQALLVAQCVARSPLGPAALRDHQWWQVDAALLAAELAPPARRALGGPIRVISGPAALTSALAMKLPEEPLVLIDGKPSRSPWVPPGLAELCGWIEIGRTQTLADGTPLGDAAPQWSWRAHPGHAGATCTTP